MSGLTASRVRAGVYTVRVRGVLFNVALMDGSTWKWEVTSRDGEYDKDEFTSKKEAMAYLEEVEESLAATAAHRAALRENKRRTKERCFLWVSGMSGYSIPDRAHILKEMFPDRSPGRARPAWVAQAQSLGDQYQLIDLIFWFGEKDDVDLSVLDRIGGEVISEESTIPEGYK